MSLTLKEKYSAVGALLHASFQFDLVQEKQFKQQFQSPHLPSRPMTAPQVGRSGGATLQLLGVASGAGPPTLLNIQGYPSGSPKASRSPSLEPGAAPTPAGQGEGDQPVPGALVGVVLSHF